MTMMKLSLMLLVAAVSSLSSLIVFLPSSSIISVNADEVDLIDCPLDCGINGYCELVYNDLVDDDDDDDDEEEEEEEDDFSNGTGNENDDNNDVDVAVAEQRQSSIMSPVIMPATVPNTGGGMQAYNEDDYFRCNCDYGYSGSSCEIIDDDVYDDDDDDDDDDVFDDNFNFNFNFNTTSTSTYYVNGFFNNGAAAAGTSASASAASVSPSSGYDDDDDVNNNNEFLFPGDGCPFDCQNDGQCISIFGGLTYACVCVEPYWGTQCEQIEPCDLDCSDIDSDITGSGSKDGAFCVDSPEDIVKDDDFNSQFGLPPVHTCVHCEEILEEPACDRTCLNGGVCGFNYLFTSADNEDEDEPTTTTTTTTVGPSFQCSSTVSMVTVTNNGNDDGATQQQLQIEWQDLPPYTSYCICPVGYQGKDCEEIDVCGGCQNNGYCISKETPENNSDDVFSGLNFDDDDDFNNNFDDDDFNINFDDQSNFNFDDQFDFNFDDGYVQGVLCPSQPAENYCNCGTDCGENLDGCSCDAAQSCCNGVPFSTQTAPPTDPQPYCSCEYGYFGNLCEQTMTTICIPGFQVVHDYCVKAGGFCPLDMNLVGERFCANGGTCGDGYGDGDGDGDITSSLMEG
jgi:hypothetical protein